MNKPLVTCEYCHNPIQADECLICKHSQPIEVYFDDTKYTFEDVLCRVHVMKPLSEALRGLTKFT